MVGGEDEQQKVESGDESVSREITRKEIRNDTF